MLFNSGIFAVFLAVVLAVHWTLRSHRARNVFLLAASYLFYGWWDWRFLLLLVGSSTFDYAFGLLIHGTEEERRRKLFLWASLAVNIGTLVFFKYFNFFSENLQTAAATLGLHLSWPVLRVILPLGVSFYTFQSLTYTIDVYRRRMPPCRDFLDFLLFVAYFPQLVAGPISKARQLIPELQRPRVFDPARAAEAIPYIVVGYVFKTVVADNLSGIVTSALANVSAHSGLEMLIVVYALGYETYADFAGYSYIAIGISMLFNITLPQNFLSPFLSQSIREHWMRWHISLTSWFREYFYMSLPSSRESKGRGRFNVVLTFVVSGLWHGASWSRIAWGFLSGVAYFIPPVFRQPSKIGRIVNTFVALTLAVMALTFFRVERISNAFAVFHQIGTSFWPVAGERGVSEIFEVYWWRVAIMIGVMAFEIIQRNARDLPRIYKWPTPARYAFYAFLAVMYFYRGNFERIPFIYFQF